MDKKVLITGSEGYIGRRLVAKLKSKMTVFGIDIAPEASADYGYQSMDIRSTELAGFMKEHGITHVVHLASIVTPSKDTARDYDVDVNGSRNVIEAALAAGVEHLTVTSSGAAYGYYADNPEWICENDPLRGNDSFAYSRHKRLVEEMLASYQASHPNLKQLILRPGTVLGETTDNLITKLFAKKRLLEIKDSASPFVFIWDEDVVNIIEKGVETSAQGAFNLAGTGALTVAEIAHLLGKRTRRLKASTLKRVIAIARCLKLTPYGPDQVDFLRYRPVLDNRKLREEFGYEPQKTSKEVFEFYAKSRGLI